MLDRQFGEVSYYITVSQRTRVFSFLFRMGKGRSLAFLYGDSNRYNEQQTFLNAVVVVHRWEMEKQRLQNGGQSDDTRQHCGDHATQQKQLKSCGSINRHRTTPEEERRRPRNA